MYNSVKNWLVFIVGTIFSISFLSIATLFISRYGFLRSISQTQKVFQDAARVGLPCASAYEIMCQQENKNPLEISLLGDSGLPHSTLVPMIELLKLREAKRVLEIGTQYGKTTWHLAENLPVGGHLWTVDLPETGDSEHGGRETQPGHKAGEFFRGTQAQERITQVFKNSLTLSPDDFPTLFDYVFIDANHAYDFARADTITALRLLDEDAVIVWHDYYTLDPRIGVRRFLHELHAEGFPLYRLSESTCAAAFINSALREKLLEFLEA